ncbi:GNAT family N-acetyltransferase [Qipengyuania soli]|uniref:GNAT family N-acetyltransferase n=1 Tax=Qipengyuania soli TaxID=2782568 RepID=A0A7S8F6B9_9SPHN|nr:GNAT family N-acetyltransferase [Qipengyuania soli]QPC99808.1 GNAT family N-acetyltransferase [Qipengyuania soli]
MDAGEIDLGLQLNHASKRDARKIGSITADAFRNDPFNLWLFGNFAGIRNLFHMQARNIYVPRGYCYSLGDEGACMWMLPGGDASFSNWDYFRFAVPTALMCGPGAVKRGILTGEAMDSVHPNFPHAYLFSIGVRPAAQGKGLGRKLIAPVLAACDRAEMPAYLENSNPANHGFYSSCGFEVCGDPLHPQPNSPPLVPMLRQPRSA